MVDRRRHRGLIAVGFACNPSDGAESPRFTRTDLALVAAALATVALALPGFEWSLGGRDAGTYVNEVVQIQDRGAVEISEPSLDTIPADVQRALPSAGATRASTSATSRVRSSGSGSTPGPRCAPPPAMRRETRAPGRCR